MTEEQWKRVRELMEREMPPGFVTGQTTIHWHDGHPMTCDVFKRGRRAGDLDLQEVGDAS